MILIAKSWEVTKEVRKWKAVKRSWLSKSSIMFWVGVFRSNCWIRTFFSVFYAQNLIAQTEYCWLKIVAFAIKNWTPTYLSTGNNPGLFFSWCSIDFRKFVFSFMVDIYFSLLVQMLKNTYILLTSRHQVEIATWKISLYKTYTVQSTHTCLESTHLI